jgi:signal transduction histidine kinase
MIGAFGQFRDITDLKETEQLLRESEKLSVVGQLAAGVAHEIRNPLSTLRGFSQLLKTKCKEHRHYFDIMITELDRINFIISEFLVLAKPQAVHFSVKNLLIILRETVLAFNARTSMNKVEIVIDDALDSFYIRCDENQIKQVFINILKNALEAMPQGGRIFIKFATTDDDKVSIRFIDEGCGIPEDQLDKLGEPFFTTKATGTGLGLIVSKKIVHNHQGSITIKSEINKGTVVDVTLPLCLDRPTVVPYDSRGN